MHICVFLFGVLPVYYVWCIMCSFCSSCIMFGVCLCIFQKFGIIMLFAGIICYCALSAMLFLVIYVVLFMYYALALFVCSCYYMLYSGVLFVGMLYYMWWLVYMVLLVVGVVIPVDYMCDPCLFLNGIYDVFGMNYYCMIMLLLLLCHCAFKRLYRNIARILQ